VLDIVVHKNVRLSEGIASDILDSDHLPVVFHLLDHVRTRNLSDFFSDLNETCVRQSGFYTEESKGWKPLPVNE
jgi:hypothetical protein